MKRIFLLFFAVPYITAAQDIIVKYTFSDHAGNTVFDESPNGNNATMYGGAYIGGYPDDIRALFVGKTNQDYLAVPPEVLDGLDDFALRIRFRIMGEHTGSNESQNTVFSASNSSCIPCYGFTYHAKSNSWKLTFNGVTYFFPAPGLTFTDEIYLQRENGIVSVYVEDELLGDFIDTDPVEITTFIVGQKENCLGGCFQSNQSLQGGVNMFAVWDWAKPLKEPLAEAEEEFTVYPNPFVNQLQVVVGGAYPDDLFDIEIVDVTGKSIVQKKIRSGDIIDLARPLDAGLYFYMLKKGDLLVGTGKVVAQ